MQILTSLEKNISKSAEVNIDVSHLGMTISKYHSESVKLSASSAVFTPNPGEYFQRYQVVLHSQSKKMFQITEVEVYWIKDGKEFETKIKLLGIKLLFHLDVITNY